MINSMDVQLHGADVRVMFVFINDEGHINYLETEQL